MGISDSHVGVSYPQPPFHREAYVGDIRSVPIEFRSMAWLLIIPLYIVSDTKISVINVFRAVHGSVINSPRGPCGRYYTHIHKADLHSEIECILTELKVKAGRCLSGPEPHRVHTVVTVARDRAVIGHRKHSLHTTNTHKNTCKYQTHAQTPQSLSIVFLTRTGVVFSSLNLLTRTLFN